MRMQSPACSGRRMERPTTVGAMCEAAAEGNLPELRRLLAADPGLATATDSAGQTPLWWAAAMLGEEPFYVCPLAYLDGGETYVDAVHVLLEAAPAAALIADKEGCLPLHLAARRSYAEPEGVQLLLEAAPEAAMAADAEGGLPLHRAAIGGSTEAARLLLEAAPQAALTADTEGRLPLHEAASHAESADVVRLLLEAAPEAALVADAEGWLPLHLQQPLAAQNPCACCWKQRQRPP